jgi:peptide/nickel transport system substrate-binding protein
VVFNFERMLNEDHPYHDTGPFPLSFFFSAVESVEATGAMEVTFTLNAPYAPFLSNLAYPTGLIVSPGGGDGAWAGLRPEPLGHRALHLHRVALERGRGDRGNPDYWDGAPELQAVVFRPITDANTRTAEMLAGGIDVMVEVPPVA